jgi:hypothetical protein
VDVAREHDHVSLDMRWLEGTELQMQVGKDAESHEVQASRGYAEV